MYKLEVRESVVKALKKLKRKNRVRYNAIHKKVKEILQNILQNPRRYKSLKKPLQHLKRVHFGPFVLTFSIDEKTRTVILEDYRHHDEIYKIK